MSAQLIRALGRQGAVQLKPVKRHWVCASGCGVTQVTEVAAPHLELHHCSRHRGAIVPLVEDGVKAGIRINRREDYLGTDTATTDGDGVPVMSVTTLRDDGEDCTVFAPCVNVKIIT